MSAVKILREARALIADKSRWTTETYARDSNGIATQYDSPEGICYCALGALYKAAGSVVWAAEAEGILNTAAKPYLDAADVRGSIACINDGDVQISDLESHDAVIRVYSEAISIAEAANA